MNQKDPARTPLVLLAWACAVLAVALTAWAAGWLDDGEDDDAASGEDAPAAAIGPGDGTDLTEYEAERAEALGEATGERVAVVSFTSYRPASAAQRVLDGVARGDAGPVEVVRWLVALPGGQPQVTGPDLGEWAAAVTRQAAEERAEIEALLPTVEPDSEFAEFYEQELERLAALAAGVDPDGEFVFGVAVRAGAPALRALAEEGEVRLVDVGPSARLGGVRGLRPEETARAGEPPTRPL